jgi:hypothetical protein
MKPDELFEENKALKQKLLEVRTKTIEECALRCATNLWLTPQDRFEAAADLRAMSRYPEDLAILDVDRIAEALASESIPVPPGMDREQTRQFILSHANAAGPKVRAADLSEEELRFFDLVRANPGCKLNGPNQAIGQDGKGLWERLEAWGLIKCVGSYKWRAIEKDVSDSKGEPQ